jgi:hypothetical protein
LSARIACALLAAIGLAAIAEPAHAQQAALETIADVDLWKTDAGSRLLMRNAGNAFAEGRLHALGVLRPTQLLELRAVAEGYVTMARPRDAEANIELLSLRFFPSRALVFEAGKMLMPMGTFGTRRFSNTNPLIGAPDLYPVLYPWGALLSGGIGRIDYRAALVSLPSINPSYSPVPGKRLRPVVGLGVSIGPALRIGAALTHGSYLGPDQASVLPQGSAWQGYQQTVIAGDFHFSVGYVDTRAELAWSSYDVPTIAAPVRGLGWYTEIRVTHTPRIFTAFRFERNRYPFIRPISRTRWIGNPVMQMNGEAGIGYRVSNATLLKISYRRDYWPDEPAPGAPPSPDGYALAMQLSLTTNILDVFTRVY